MKNRSEDVVKESLNLLEDLPVNNENR